MTVTETPNVANALETKVASHLHPEGSFDVEFFEVPTGREEVWRFTPLKRLRDLHKDAPLGSGTTTVDVDAAAGVTVTRVDAGASVRGSSGYVPVDRVSARAWAAAEEATVITIPADTVVDGATVVSNRGTGVEHASAGHAVIVAEPHSKATVVLRFEGSAVVADNVEIVVGDGAHLTVVSVQDWADDAVHHSSQHAKVGRDATFRHVAVSFGGDLVRMNTSVAYDGPGGEAELLGLYFADAGQHLEHRLFVDHAERNCRSRVSYKGALQGQDAHAVWIGDVVIRAEATGTDTYEYNRNLVLTDGTRVDSVPNLEILTGEVLGAGHASTSGRLEDQHLFYLMARGIPEAEARRLVIQGFFGELIDRIEVPELAERVAAAIERELAREAG